MGDSEFTIKDFAISTQKKFAQKLATNAVIRNSLIDDSITEIFNLINKIIKLYLNDKKKAEKVMKDVIKIIVKLGVLQHNNRLDQKMVRDANAHLRHAVLTMISFHEVEFTFERTLAVHKMKTVKDVITSLLKNGQVTEKTHGRLNNVMSVLGESDFLYALYHEEKFKPLVSELARLLNDAIEQGKI